MDWKTVQNVIGYKFDNEDLLQQAFVRKSYSAENGGQNNEVLEFIGDKALDLAIIRLMMEKFGVITEEKEYQEFKLRNPRYFKTKLSEGKFTDIKKDLVKKKSLASCMTDLGFSSLLIMGNGDEVNNVQEKDSVKEDLFEAIIGAVALDSNWDMDEITSVVETMIDFEAYFEREKDTNFVGFLQEFCQRYNLPVPEYRYLESRDGGFVAEASLAINDNFFKAMGYGVNKAKARAEVAYALKQRLRDAGYILSPLMEAVGEPCLETASRQLNELFAKKLISTPVYKFSRTIEQMSKEEVWACDISIDNFDYPASGFGKTKSEAKNEAAFDMLSALMNESKIHSMCTY